MFKFGFSDEKKLEQSDALTKWNKCEEIVCTENLYALDVLRNERVKSISLSNSVLKYLSQDSVLELIKKNEEVETASISKAEQNHSDLLPAVYEGGLKVWECTYDLLSFIHGKALVFQSKCCLDLGCGSGMIGVYCLLQGAMCTFQDYNTDVVKYFTIPNVILNQNSTKNCKFYSGDWESFNDVLTDFPNEQYKHDYIFTSETIYNIESYPKLHRIFETCLKKNGTIFLAAKSYYFGVGGGINLFQTYMDENKIFKYETCWEKSEGIKRIILKITFM